MDDVRDMKPTFFARFGLGFLLAFLLALPVLILAAQRAMLTANNNVRQWLPADSPETNDYDWFSKLFDDDEAVIVSWVGCTVDDPRLPVVTDLLGGGQHPEMSRFFRTAVSGGDMLAQLTVPPFNLEYDDAVARLRGAMIGHDNVSTAIVLQLTPEGNASRLAMVNALYATLAKETDLTPDQLRISGAPVVNAAVDRESGNAIGQLIGLSAGVAITIALCGLRSGIFTAMIFLVAWYCALVGLALVYFLDGTMNLVLVVMPVLQGLLGMSGSIHMVNYYREATAELGVKRAAGETLKMCWLPCFLSAATTAIGLGSLCVSEIIPVQSFGLYAAIGTMLGLVVLFLALPSALEMWPVRPSARHNRLEPTWLEQVSSGLAQRICRHSLVLLSISLMGGAALGWGLLYVDTSVKPIHFFPPESLVHRDLHWLEDKLGPVVPLEVVLTFDQFNTLSFLERAELVAHVQREIGAIPEVGHTLSAVTYMPPREEFAWTPDAERSTLELLQRKTFNKALGKNRSAFMGQHFLAEDANQGQEYWRISARVGALNAMSYDLFLGEVRSKVEPFLTAEKARGNIGIQATFTGMDPVLFRAQRMLFDGLVSSFVSAFALIGLVMIVLLRGLSAGLLSMLPNVFPAVVVFGFMGWAGLAIDVGSMMTASVAMGIAVDDTLHYLTWFRRGLEQGLNRTQAIELAYVRCSGAMLQTTLIAGLGMAVLGLSDFLPVAQFGLLMCAMLMAGLIGDLLVLPALLASPLGVVFDWHPNHSTNVVMPLEPAVEVSAAGSSLGVGDAETVCMEVGSSAQTDRT